MFSHSKGVCYFFTKIYDSEDLKNFNVSSNHCTCFISVQHSSSLISSIKKRNLVIFDEHVHKIVCTFWGCCATFKKFVNFLCSSSSSFELEPKLAHLHDFVEEAI